MERDSKEYSWKWVTADELLSHGACELLYAQTICAQGESNTYLYDGENTGGTPIFHFRSGVKRGQVFSPKVPVYCRRGLYFDKGTNTLGIFVQWRELGHRGEGG